MTRRRRSPAQEKAIAYLRRRAEAGHFGTVRLMAREAGVSLVTMSKAVGELKRRGVLQTNHRHGITLATEMVQEERRGGKRWERVARELSADIAAGHYRRNALLPSCKELAARYGVCAPTMAKGLRRLQAQGDLVRWVRGYQVAPGPRTSARKALVIFTRGLYQRDQLLLPPRREEILRALERRCSHANLDVILVRYHNIDGRIVPVGDDERVLGDTAVMDRAVGFLVMASGLGWPMVDALVGRLVGRYRPIAVFDESGVAAERLRAFRRSTRVFALATSQDCGVAVGHYLRRLGHRRIAYLSLSSGAIWSRNRAAGLVRAFAEAGVVCDLVECAADQPQEPWEGQEQAEDVVRLIGDMIDRGLDPSEPLQQRLARAVEISKPHIRSALGRQRFRESLEPLMSAALASDATVWVAAHDTIAVQCSDFLERHGRAVPDNLSLISFDDTPEAYLRRITSYNFDAPALVYAMVDYLLSSRRMSRPGNRAVEVEGFIDERGSVAPV